MSTSLRLKISQDLLQTISKLHPTLKKKVCSGFDCLLKNPYEGKALRAELIGLWSLRMGRFRIIYRISGKKLEIVSVGPRKSIYQEVALLGSSS
jgi:mRNA-degrading endonuclease RelE of RelBE toxin-antitoxin system